MLACSLYFSDVRFRESVHSDLRYSSTQRTPIRWTRSCFRRMPRVSARRTNTHPGRVVCQAEASGAWKTSPKVKIVERTGSSKRRLAVHQKIRRVIGKTVKRRGISQSHLRANGCGSLPHPISKKRAFENARSARICNIDDLKSLDCPRKPAFQWRLRAFVVATKRPRKEKPGSSRAE